MERYQRIIEDEVYIRHIRKTEEYEKNREFGHHDMQHFLDVARVGMLINLTEGYNIPKDMIYAAALLHDVGRDVQYEDGTPHDIASVDITKDIFTRIGDDIKNECADNGERDLSKLFYTKEEQEEILAAIGDHRNKDIRMEKSLAGLLYRADKESRPCYFCKAYEECNWKPDKKNDYLIW